VRGGIVFREQIALDQLDQDVDHLDVQLLHAIGVIPVASGTITIIRGVV